MAQKKIDPIDATSAAVGDILGVPRYGGSGGVGGAIPGKAKPKVSSKKTKDLDVGSTKSPSEIMAKQKDEATPRETGGYDVVPPSTPRKSTVAEPEKKSSSNLGKGIAATAAGAAAAVGLGSLAGSKIGNGVDKKSEDSSSDEETETSSPSRSKSTDEDTGPTPSFSSGRSKFTDEGTGPTPSFSTGRSKSTDEGTGPSVSMTSMKINKGDTLSAIAKRHGTTVKDLMDSNPDIKDANKIYAGKSLSLKKKPEVSQDGYKKGGSLRRSGGGGLGVGQALRGWGAVRKK
jgi:LysM repeat protein